MIKLINLIETRIIPRGKKEFLATKKSNKGDVVGNLTIGSLTLETNLLYHIYLDADEDELIIFFNDKEPVDVIINRFEDNLKNYNIKYEFNDEYYTQFTIPIKENNIKIINDVNETKVTPKTNKLPFLRHVGPAGNSMGYITAILDDGGGKHVFTGIIKNKEIVFIYFKGRDMYYNLLNKLKKERIPYTEKEYEDGDVEVIVDKKYFDISEKKTLGETKVTPKGKREFHVDKKELNNIYGILTIGTNIFQAFIDDSYDIDTIFIEVDPNIDDIVDEYEEKLKSNNIKFEKDFMGDDDYSFFIIPIESNKIRIIDSIEETKIAPKSNKEFRVTEKTNDYVNGKLTIGNNTQWGYIREDDGEDIVVILHYEGNENEISEFKNNLSKNNILYMDDDESDDEYIYFFIPIKMNKIKIIDNIGETKIAPRKPFMLFPSTVDNVKNLYVDNDVISPYYNYAVYLDDDVVEGKVEIQILYSTNDRDNFYNIKWINYLNKKTKSLSGVEKDTNTIQMEPYEKTWFIFKIPLKYFEIKNND